MVNEASDPVLVVFCRRPKLGSGKQRIAAELGKPIALQITQLLLDAALEDANDWPGEVVLAPANEADADWAGSLLPGVRVVAQPQGSLGHRINHVDIQVRARGAREVLFIGTDAPGLCATDLANATTALKQTSAVFVPAADGGVTLLGANKSWPQLDDLAWETPGLHSDIKARCESVGWNCTDLEVGFDVDTRADLILACQRLAHDPRAARQKLCRWIKSAELENLEPISWPPAPDTVGVIIPVYNDTDALEQLLCRLKDLESQPDEILVIDGTDNTACSQICESHDARYFRTQPCRGAQLHLGATLARSEILWFLHADAEPVNDAIRLIREHLGVGNTGGYFRFQFSGTATWYQRLLETAINWRARYGTPYGDQGLFMRQESYCLAGGFPSEPLFEEVSLVKNLRRVGGFTALDAQIGVATRRWERDGWLRRTLRNRMLAIRFMLGAEPQRLAHTYKPELQTDQND